MENATASIGSLKAPLSLPLCMSLSGNYIGLNTILKAERVTVPKSELLSKSRGKANLALFFVILKKKKKSGIFFYKRK